MNETPIKTLLFEDNPGDARLLIFFLTSANDPSFDVLHVDHLEAGLERLQQGDINAILLDLGLPDSQGLDTFLHVFGHAPDIPIIILTGLDDTALGLKAVQAGAQDYLVKGQVDEDLLLRALRYAIERKRLLAELELVREREQAERERRSMESLTRSTTATAQASDLPTLRQGKPDIFAELVEHYMELLEQALEQRTFKVEYPIPETLRRLGEQLGSEQAGPRDVVEIHNAALKQKGQQSTPQKTRAYLEEGRMLVLQLMGYLAAYYRNQHLLALS